MTLQIVLNGAVIIEYVFIEISNAVVAARNIAVVFPQGFFPVLQRIAVIIQCPVEVAEFAVNTANGVYAVQSREMCITKFCLPYLQGSQVMRQRFVQLTLIFINL